MGRERKEKKSSTGYNQNGYVCLKLIELSLEQEKKKREMSNAKDYVNFVKLALYFIY